MTQNLNKDNSRNERLVHIDAMRGLTMLLVVYWHIIESLGTQSDLIRLFSLFRMPMFLTISGFLAFSVNYDADKVYKRSLNRLVRQLYPTILLWLAHVALTSIYNSSRMPSLLTLLCDPFKHGFWFTFALVELFFIALPMFVLFNKMQWSKHVMTFVLVCICLFFVFIENPVNNFIDNYWFMDLIGNGLNLKVVVGSGFCFFFGMIAKLHHIKLERNGRKWITLLVAFLIFVLFSRIYFMDFSSGIHRFAHYVSAISGMLSLYCIFLKLTSASNGLIQKSIYYLTIVGKRTLEIYLLHRFILLYAEPLIRNLGIEDILNTLYEFPIVFSIAVMIAVMIITFLKLLKYVGIYTLIFPQNTSKLSNWQNLYKAKPKTV